MALNTRAGGRTTASMDKADLPSNLREKEKKAWFMKDCSKTECSKDTVDCTMPTVTTTRERLRTASDKVEAS